MQLCHCKVFEEKTVKKIKVEQKEFDYYPREGNDGCQFKNGDIAKNGWKEANHWIDTMILIDETEPLLFDSWKIKKHI